MKRLSSIALLSGTALAFVGGAQAPPVAAGPNPCSFETECTFRKPLLAIVLDDSTAMNQPFDADHTRWQTAITAIHALIDYDNGYIAENYILGLLRFGHDPNPALSGTTIAGDTTGLVDGVKLDVPWYDPDDPNKAYGECTNSDEIGAVLDALPAPLGGAATGIGTWTRGALMFAQSYLATTAADHPDDLGKRRAALLVLTTGAWTDPTGALQQAPATEAPTLVAADLWVNQAVPTYVVALGGPADKPLADALADAGGTAQSIGPVPDLQPIIDSFKQAIEDIKSLIDPPVCTPGIPRVMVLLDASSSMLNKDGTQAEPGEGPWDLVRGKLAGEDSIFDLPIGPDNAAGNIFYFGLSVFGSPDEEKLLVQYGSCTEDRLAWALDPTSSCVAPGCTDPYAPGPITWTFQDGSLLDPPLFGLPTFSHMPRCDVSAQMPGKCIGSNNATHLGLELVHSNLTAYRTACLDFGAAVPCNENTTFLNVLITDGAYDSTDAQVQAPLVAMHTAGFTTRVIGFGEDVDLAQLDKLASWGSGGLLDPVVATTQDGLEAAFQAILVAPNFDPCCQFLNCSNFVDTTGDEGGSSETNGSSSTGDTDAPVDTESPDTTGASTSTGTTGTSTSTGDDSSSSQGDSTAGLDDTGVTATADPPTGGIDSSTPTTNPTSDGPLTGGGDSSGDTDADPSETASDKGCACTSDNSSGPTGSLLLLGLLGLLAPRRRVTPRT